MKTLYEMLSNYRKSDYYGFHMPGHKRNEKIPGFHTELLPFGLDITEIEGFDDLHHARGILKEMQEKAARVFGAKYTRFLVNGSTVGILAAILGCTQRGDKILMARNCHKSVYHAVELHELQAEYVYPEYLGNEGISGKIRVEEIEKQLDLYQDIKAVVIVSPTYDGMVSDVESIAESVHRKKIPLIVDEAHGAHFGFHPVFPKNANACGADVVIHSLHKTLPALTQSALIHINGDIVDRERIEKYLSMLQSSSPSYLLMSGLDACVSWLEKDGKKVFESYVSLLKETRERLKELKKLTLLQPEDMELSKILISSRNTDMTGKKLMETLLDRFHLQMEMASTHYITAMTSVGDTREGMERLCLALETLDGEKRLKKCANNAIVLPRPEKIMSVSEMEKKEKRFEKWEKCEGKTAGEMVYVYPPGIPLIVPGERISREVIECIKLYEKNGFLIEGTKERKKIQIERD